MNGVWSFGHKPVLLSINCSNDCPSAGETHKLESDAASSVWPLFRQYQACKHELKEKRENKTATEKKAHVFVAYTFCLFTDIQNSNARIWTGFRGAFLLCSSIWPYCWVHRSWILCFYALMVWKYQINHKKAETTRPETEIKIFFCFVPLRDDNCMCVINDVCEAQDKTAKR